MNDDSPLRPLRAIIFLVLLAVLGDEVMVGAYDQDPKERQGRPAPTEFEKLEEHNLFDCIECGACSYACPSNIPLVQYYRASKAEILQLRRDHEKAEAVIPAPALY